MRRLTLPRSTFAAKLFASYAAVLVLTALCVGLLVEARLGERLLRGLESTLEQQGRLLEPFAGDSAGRSAEELQACFLELGRDTAVRLTLVEADGTVVADSAQDPARIDNHASRPEIEAAARDGVGRSRRRSHSVSREMVYVARRLEGGGFLRLAVPTDAIAEDLAVARRAVVLGALFGLAVALVLGAAFARRFSAPLAEVKRVAEDLRAGRYDSRAELDREDELGLLAETLNDLGAEITRRIAALGREDARLRAMLAGMVEGVVAVDAEDRVVFANQAARRLLDIEHAHLEGHALVELAPIREIVELLARAREVGGHEGCEVELHRSGRERVFQAQASPFEGGGQQGLVLVLHELTALRRLERVRRDFVANVSHELKTPLAAIQGFVETLLSGALHDEQNNVRFLERISANVTRLTNLVADLLSLARIESGKQEIAREPIDARGVLDDVLRLRESALSAKGLSFERDARDRPLRVLGDREALTQVLDNLLDNAIHYTPEGGRVEVAFSEALGQGVLAVRDTGMGIQ
ncbi:MAG TPA: histidine kinase dimerization/phospho-acceptor domain-containing protein, partial [Planctomycetota bacterium]|nr:histidine kinase dimerization/phospho-acceptor domain-containing protein [Planctomycetota bacterium]